MKEDKQGVVVLDARIHESDLRSLRNNCELEKSKSGEVDTLLKGNEAFIAAVAWRSL